MTTDITHRRAATAARRYGGIARSLLALPHEFAQPPAGTGLTRVPGHPGSPVFGDALRMIRDPEAFARRRFDRYGPVSWGSALGRDAVLLLGPEASEVVLANKKRAFANQPAWEVVSGKFIRRGLLILDFDEHLYHRRILQQAFTRTRLEGYLHEMNSSIARAIAQWHPGNRFLVLPEIKRVALNVATEIFLGEPLGPEADRVNRAFIDMLGAATAWVRYDVPGTRWHKAHAGRSYLEQFFAARIAAKRAGSGQDLFSVLCRAVDENGNRFTDDDVINHMIFVLFAAHDTTTITLNTMFYQLAKHPEWQDRVRAESLALNKPAIDYSDLDRLTDLDLVLKESLRMIAPVFVQVRQTVRDTDVLGYHIPGGTFVVMLPQFTHHMHEYWSAPDVFDPERFSAARREDKSHRLAWAPFGAGVHKCIGMHFGGMEIKALLHQVLQHYRWSVDPAYETRFDFSRLPVPSDQLPVRLERIA